ncbi:MAG: class I SAM-dependent methyltransferase [Spirochaetota bacterium]|nr:class I SAM-dependent methyltransferase [Spirochaetota bacterium]
MTILEKRREFLEFDSNNNFYIEPENRHSAVRERLFDIIKTYNPKIIVKAGIGSGRLLLDIAREFDIYMLVVEPSLNIIKDFLQKNREDETIERIKFLNGDLHDFPVDYYAADLLICIDYLDIFDSSRCIDEFKRALQFDKILFISGTVLNSDDIEGLYDDFMRMVFPLHNDYYLENDFRTFLELKGFELMKSMLLKFENNIKSEIEYFASIYNDKSEDSAYAFLQSNREKFNELYCMDDEYNFSTSYYIGTYMRKKPDKS